MDQRSILLMPDSFKGTMSSREICAIMVQEIAKWYPDVPVRAIPVADGGEGTVDCFLTACGGERIHCHVQGPLGEEIEACYGMIQKGQTAVIEMAAAAGLPLAAAQGCLEPGRTSTYGVGQLMADAAARGVKRMVVGLGGSATNDGGCGMAAALGVRFYDKSGKTFVPTGATLSDIYRIDLSGRLPALAKIQITAMCDIDNPMYGPTGAAYVFGPQKGADAALVKVLDANLQALAQRIQADLNIDAALLPGAGAAGALGAGMVAFCGGTLESGIATVLDVVDFPALASSAQLILTGEGKIDSQSLRGKVVIGIAQAAKTYGVPVVAIVGDVGDNIEAAYDMGVSAIFSINQVAVEFSAAKPRAKRDLAATLDNILRFSRLLDKGEQHD